VAGIVGAYENKLHAKYNPQGPRRAFAGYYAVTDRYQWPATEDGFRIQPSCERSSAMMNIGRRTFLQRLPVLFALPVVPRRLIADEPPVDLPPVDEIWLAEWQSAHRIPITDSTDNPERRVLRAMRTGEALSIVYYGGTDPGEVRSIRPALLYRVEGFSGVYLTGYCDKRHDIRTFRMDRVRLAA
jgi:hypothetical protein